MKPSCLFVGFGQIASRVFNDLSDEVEAYVLKRSLSNNLPEGICQTYLGDVATEITWRSIPSDFDIVLFCVTPGGRLAEDYRQVFHLGLQRCIRHFENAKKAPHVFFVSSTSVYSQDDGEWLDETSPAEPVSATAKVLRLAERELQNSNMPHTIVRFSGIYGADRTYMIRQVLEGQAVLSTAERLSNRIHEDDAVGFLAFLIRRVLSGDPVDALYIATDSSPCDLNEVYGFIARKLGLVPHFMKEGEETPRRTGNKRLSNQRLLESGYRLAYPGFKEGYDEMCTLVAPSRDVR